MTRIAEEVEGTEDTPEQVEDLPEELEAEPETEAEEEGDSTEGDEGEAEVAELSITLGDEPEPQPTEEEKRAAPWIRDLRKQNQKKDRELREKDRRIAELEARSKGAASSEPALGPRPTMGDPDIDYDEDKFAARLDVWLAQKAEVDNRERQKKRAVEEAEQKWQGRLTAVNGVTKAMKVPDLDEALATFEDTFSVVQRGLILDAPEDPKVSAQLRYALGRNPKVAKELAAETNPVKFTFKLAELVGKMKVTRKKSAPAPERVVRSTVAGAAAVDNQLERLRAEADKTNDRTKVAAYMRQQKHKQAA